MKSIFTLISALVCSYFTLTSSQLSASPTSSIFAQFRTNLYVTASDGTSVLMDGTLTQYDTSYSDNVDGMDARKMSNSSENFGMLRNNVVLIIERRHTIEGNDSIFFKMWNMRTVTYRLDLIASNLNVPGRIGLLQDKYLQTQTVLNLNDTTHFNFSVNSDPKSYASDRFMVVFSTPGFATLPLTFTSVKACQKDNFVKIDWTTANENGVEQYYIEKSITGNSFLKLTDVKASNTSSNDYQWMDVNPNDGNNYYRIGASSIDGKISYSQIINVRIEKENGINVYPNPAIGNNFNLQMINQPAGVYEIKLINVFGQIFMTKSIKHTSLNTTYSLRPEQNISKGIYQLQITTPGGKRKIINLIF